MQIPGPWHRPTEPESPVAGLGVCIVSTQHRGSHYIYADNPGPGGLQLCNDSEVRTSYNSLGGLRGLGHPQVQGQGTLPVILEMSVAPFAAQWGSKQVQALTRFYCIWPRPCTHRLTVITRGNSGGPVLSGSAGKWDGISHQHHRMVIALPL